MSIRKDARRKGITLCFRKNRGSFSVLKSIFIAFGIFTSLIWAAPTFAVEGVASSTQDVNVNLGASILMRILDSAATTDVSEIELNMTPTAIGTTVSDSVIVDVATSNSLGYKLYMNSDFTDGGTYTTNLVSTVGSIPSKTTLKNAWNYGTSWNESIGGAALSGSTSSQVIPAHDSPATLRNDVNVATNSSKTTVTFNVNADTNIPAGHYTNKIVFSAVASNSAFGFNLYFNANGGTGEPEPETTSSTSSSYTFTIPSTVPTNGSLTFAGWSESPSGEATYQPGDEYTIVADGVPPYSKTLYAIWSSAPAVKDFWNISTMQEMTPEICNMVYTPTATNAENTIIITSADTYTAIADGTDQVPQRTLRDERDGNEYRIRKFADGNCWMVDNLRIRLEENVTIKASKNNGDTFDFTPTTCATNGVCALNGNTPSSGSSYSWYAATAEQGTEETLGDVDGSICPVGWKLPYDKSIQTNKSYTGLYNLYNSVGAWGYYTLSSLPLEFNNTSGVYYSGKKVAGNGTGYWSSSAQQESRYKEYAYSLIWANPPTPSTWGGYNLKASGYHIRCVSI